MAKNTFAVLGIFAVLLMSLGMVSATDCLILTKISIPENVTDGEQVTVSFQLNNNCSNDTKNNLDWKLTSDKGENFEFLPMPESVSNDSAKNLNATFDLNWGQSGDLKITVYVIAEDSSKDNATLVMIIPIIPYNFCSDFSGENDTSLEISDFEINNLGVGDDEEWELLDEVTIEVEIENTDNDDVDDVMVEIMILDDNGNDVTNDFDLDDDEIDLGRIRDGDSEVAIFRINEVPADLDDGTYRLYFRAYSDGDEESHCVASSKDFDDDTYQEIEVVGLDGQAVVVKPELVRVLASCGDKNIEVSFDVYNLGNDKEEKVLVTLFSSALNVNEKMVIDDLRSGRREEVMFVFDVPEELDKKYYDLKVITYYDYDNDEDELSEYSYGESSYNDLDKDFSVRLEILSCKDPAPTVSANLESVAEVGEELIVKATIVNNGKDNDFVVSVSDFEGWATLVNITPVTVSIDGDEEAEVIITFKPTVSGAHLFKVNTLVDGESYEQSVSVNITEEPSVFAGISNTMLYTASGIVAVLIVIFIVLIVRISRRPAKPQF